MSNYLSEKINYSAPPTDANFELLAKIALMKDAKYDANRATLQSQLTKFGITDVLRPEDSDYISKRLSEITNSLNSTGKGLDLSKGYVNDALSQSITGAYEDPRIISAITIAKRWRNYEAEGAKKQEQDLNRKDGEARVFNQANFDYGKDMAKVDDYIAGRVDNIGALNYVNYRDVDAKQYKALTEFEKLNKDTVIELPDYNNPGATIKTTKSNLSPQQIEQIVSHNLDADDYKQIEINSYYSSDKYADPAKLKADVGVLFNSKIEDAQNEIKKIEVTLANGGISPEQEAVLKSNKAYNESEIATLKTNLTTVTETPRQAASFLERNRIIQDAKGSFGALYSVSVINGVDEKYYKDRNLKIAEAELVIKQETSIREQKAADEKAKPKPSAEYMTAPSQKAYADEDEQDKKITTEITRLSTDMSQTVKQFRKGLELSAKTDDAKGKSANVVLNNYKANLKAGQADEVAMKNAMLLIDSNDGVVMQFDENGVMNNMLEKLKDVDGKHHTYTVGFAKVIKESENFVAQSTLDSPEYFKQINADPQTKILWKDANGKPTTYSLRKLLIDNKFMNEDGTRLKSITSSPEFFENLKRNYYASQVLSGRQGINIDSASLAKLAHSFGEDASKVYTYNLTGNMYTGYKNSPNLSTKTGQFLANAQKNGIYDTNEASDSSLTGDDQVTGKFGKEDYRDTKLYIDGVKKLAGMLSSNIAVVVSKQSAEDHAVLGNIVTSKISQTPSGKYNPETPFNLTLSDDGKTVTISQYSETAKKAGTDQKLVTYEGDVDVNTFSRNAPQIAKKLQLDNKQAHYTVGRTTDLDMVSKPVKFYNTQTDESLSAYNLKKLEGKPVFQSYLVAETAMEQTNMNLQAAFGENTEAQILADAAIKKSANYHITGKITPDFNNSNILTIYMKKGDQIIHKKEVKDVKDVDEYKKLIDNTPQVLFADLINDIMQNQILTKLTNKKDSPAYTKLANSL